MLRNYLPPAHPTVILFLAYTIESLDAPAKCYQHNAGANRQAGYTA